MCIDTLNQERTMQNIYGWLVQLHRGGTKSLTVVFCSMYLRALLNNMPMSVYIEFRAV